MTAVLSIKECTRCLQEGLQIVSVDEAESLIKLSLLTEDYDTLYNFVVTIIELDVRSSYILAWAALLYWKRGDYINFRTYSLRSRVMATLEDSSRKERVFKILSSVDAVLTKS